MTSLLLANRLPVTPQGPSCKRPLRDGAPQAQRAPVLLPIHQDGGEPSPGFCSKEQELELDRAVESAVSIHGRLLAAYERTYADGRRLQARIDTERQVSECHEELF